MEKVYLMKRNGQLISGEPSSYDRTKETRIQRTIGDCFEAFKKDPKYYIFGYFVACDPDRATTFFSFIHQYFGSNYLGLRIIGPNNEKIMETAEDFEKLSGLELDERVGKVYLGL